MALSGSQVTQHSVAGRIRMPFGSFAGKTALNLGTIVRAVELTGLFDIGVTLTGTFDTGVTLTGQADPT